MLWTAWALGVHPTSGSHNDMGYGFIGDVHVWLGARTPHSPTTHQVPLAHNGSGVASLLSQLAHGGLVQRRANVGGGFNDGRDSRARGCHQGTTCSVTSRRMQVWCRDAGVQGCRGAVKTAHTTHGRTRGRSAAKRALQSQISGLLCRPVMRAAREALHRGAPLYHVPSRMPPNL
jgi:hypothetical protein